MTVPFLPTTSTFFIILSAVFVAIGWNLIRKKRIEAHKKMMIAAAVSAVLFFIIYISRTIVVGNTSFGGPDSLKIYYTIFLVFHIILATTGAIIGVITIRAGLKNNLQIHRKIGPVTELTNKKSHSFRGDDSEFGVRHLLARCREPTSINFCSFCCLYIYVAIANVRSI